MVEVTPPGGAGGGDSSSESSDTDRDKRDDRNETPTSSTPGTGGGIIRDPSADTGGTESTDSKNAGDDGTGESETKSDTGGTEQTQEQQGRSTFNDVERDQRQSLESHQEHEASDQDRLQSAEQKIRGTSFGITGTDRSVSRESADRIGETVDEGVERARSTGDTARDVVMRGHEDDSVSTNDLYEATGADTAVDATFQESTTLSIEESLGIPEGERSDDVDISGPGVSTEGIESGAGGEVNEDVVETLTGGDGLLSDEQRQDLQETAEQRREYFGVEEEAEMAAEDLGHGERVTNFVRGVGQAPGDIASAPASIALAADTAVQAGQNAPEAVEEAGAEDVALTTLELGGRATQAAVEEVSENPYEAAGRFTGEIAAGTLAIRGAAGASTRVRSARTRLEADGTVEYEDITSERGARGENPRFETDTNAPTEEAVDEVSDRARDQPDAVQEQAGTDQVLFHSTQADLGGDLDVGEGASELPGIFTSPDTSPLGLSEGGSSTLASLRPRLPRRRDFSGESDRVAAFQGDRIEGMPDDATGAGYAVRDESGDVVEQGLGRGEASAIAEDIGGERVPDPDTSGYQFLTESADEGVAYVRPPGSRTPELETVISPGSQFERTGTIAVDMGDRTIPLETYRRREGSRDSGVGGDGGSMGEGADAGDSDVQTASEISRRTSGRRPEGTPVAPPIVPSSSTPTRTSQNTTGGSTTTTSGPGGSSGPLSGFTLPVGGGSSGPSAGGSGPSGTPGIPTMTGGPSSPGSSSPGGSGSPPGGSGSSGGSGPPNNAGTTPPRSRLPLPDGDNEDSEEGTFGFEGTSDEIRTSFVNPLTGDLLDS